MAIQLNTANILALADTIEEAGDTHFIMDTYCNGPAIGLSAQEIKHTCGAAACIAGWADAAEMKGNSTQYGTEEIALKHILKDYEPTGGYPWREKETNELARALFMPRGFDDIPEQFTAKRAAAVLRHLAETGEVAWDEFNLSGERQYTPLRFINEDDDEEEET